MRDFEDIGFEARYWLEAITLVKEINNSAETISDNVSIDQTEKLLLLGMSHGFGQQFLDIIEELQDKTKNQQDAILETIDKLETLARLVDGRITALNEEVGIDDAEV